MTRDRVGEQGRDGKEEKSGRQEVRHEESRITGTCMYYTKFELV